MKDSQGNELNVGDQFTCRHGLYTVLSLNGPDYMTAEGKRNHGFGYSQEIFSREYPEAVKVSHHNVKGNELSDLRERMGLLVTKAYFMVSRANPDLSVRQRERLAMDLVRTLTLEVE